MVGALANLSACRLVGLLACWEVGRTGRREWGWGLLGLSRASARAGPAGVAGSGRAAGGAVYGKGCSDGRASAALPWCSGRGGGGWDV